MHKEILNQAQNSYFQVFRFVLSYSNFQNYKSVGNVSTQAYMHAQMDNQPKNIIPLDQVLERGG